LKKSEEIKVEIEIQRSVKAGIREFLKNKVYVINLCLNMILWAIIDMDYQINDYYNNYFPTDSYENTIAIATVELFGYIFACFIFEMFESKKSTKTYLVSYALCLFGALWIINNDPKKHPDIDLFCDYLCKFGIASAF
jgi:Na+/melibiose symporter-like transporter